MLQKRFNKRSKKMIKVAVKKVIKKILSKFMVKGLAKKIPVAGIAAGTVLAMKKAFNGNWSGAGMEFSSGLVSVFPVVGTSVSAALDLGLLAQDV